MKIQLISKVLLVTSSFAMLTMYQNCSQIAFKNISLNEATKLTAKPFEAINNVAGVEGADGLPSENLRVITAVEAAKSFVKDCSKPVKLPDGTSQSRYDFEKAAALKIAANDPNKKTIPVEFAVSFGQKEDRLAYWAHIRAILTEGSKTTTSYIPVGGKNDSMFTDQGTSFDAYYVADHSAAKEHYIYGSNCFFDTVTIKGELVKKPRVDGNSRYDFINESDVAMRHSIHYMTFGFCHTSAAQQCADETAPYGKGFYGAGSYPNRLFGAWPHMEAGAPQIVKLYVADLRDSHFGLSTETNKIVKAAEQFQRGSEVRMNVKNQLDVKTIFRNRETAILNLSKKFVSPSTKEVFAGMRGVPQLLSNLSLAGASGTVLAAQYTPIVLDLGAEKVKTSGVFAGSFFNMSGKTEMAQGKQNSNFTQQTAWLSGNLVSKPSRTVASDSDNASIVANFQREVEDGFLVLADDKGQVESSRQLFGDNTIVNGKSYANGFLALQALAKKDCKSTLTTDRYFGPWDGAMYTTRVKVWIDANRNGVVDSGELKTLQEAGVVAINACNVVSAEAKDAFGNGTSLRSAFLYNESKENLAGKNDEIVKRLQTGKTSAGVDAKFRLAIDLIFNVNEELTLD